MRARIATQRFKPSAKLATVTAETRKNRRKHHKLNRNRRMGQVRAFTGLANSDNELWRRWRRPSTAAVSTAVTGRTPAVVELHGSDGVKVINHHHHVFSCMATTVTETAVASSEVDDGRGLGGEFSFNVALSLSSIPFLSLSRSLFLFELETAAAVALPLAGAVTSLSSFSLLLVWVALFVAVCIVIVASKGDGVKEGCG
ncbi:hypothetical protein PIB30_013344 [Stylosanthes scabra]|uniref:Uncharacterized protein n=1 Tax=Stylosanthes scabra TaxID=79078 RepID=A0ABU6U6L1_9FABA|nr:hypothetical protein [Stylosanthes scabra]